MVPKGRRGARQSGGLSKPVDTQKHLKTVFDTLYSSKENAE
jgi:hypothetical protein